LIKFLAKYYKAVVHSIVWLIFAVLQIGYFSSISTISIAYQRGILLIIIYLITFYLNWFIFVPRLYVNKKYLLYILSAILLLSVTVALRVAIEKHFNVAPDALKRKPYFDKDVRIIIFAIAASAFTFITSFLLRIADFYTLQSRQKDILQQQKTEAEIKFLKAQLNPHFLFNALNNIYALVLTRSENAAESLMSLSQLLRYIIYDAEVEKVSLEKEIVYLKYYIELESLRLADKNKLKINIVVDPNNHKIMPMIFIPFVENSFKHSDINKDGSIEISLKLNGNQLEFICENTYSSVPKSVDHVGGIGLENSKKRLEMVYPQKHKLEIINKDGIYRVALKIDL